QLSYAPDKLEKWIIPGTAGLFGVLINMNFNNPRKHAREDLTVLMNTTMIFLGFLRQLNEVDATFKHSYIENRDFGTQEMVKTVQEINNAMLQSLNMTAHHLHIPQGLLNRRDKSCTQNQS